MEVALTQINKQADYLALRNRNNNKQSHYLAPNQILHNNHHRVDFLEDNHNNRNKEAVYLEDSLHNNNKEEDYLERSHNNHNNNSNKVEDCLVEVRGVLIILVLESLINQTLLRNNKDHYSDNSRDKLQLDYLVLRRINKQAEVGSIQIVLPKDNNNGEDLARSLYSNSLLKLLVLDLWIRISRNKIRFNARC